MRWAFASLVVSVLVVLGVILGLAWRPWSSDHNETPTLVPSRQPVATWVMDGEVHDVAQAGGKVFAAGSFTRVTSWMGGFAGVDGSGRPVDVLPWVDGEVTTLVSDGSGGWFVGGDFDRSEGGRCPNLVHVRASGGVAPRFCAHVEAVRQLALAGGRLYVGADDCCDETTSELVALDPATGNALDWKLEAGGGYYANDGIGRDDVAPGFAALATDGKTLYVGGFFDSRERRISQPPRGD